MCRQCEQTASLTAASTIAHYCRRQQIVVTRVPAYCFRRCYRWRKLINHKQDQRLSLLCGPWCGPTQTHRCARSLYELTRGSGCKCDTAACIRPAQTVAMIILMIKIIYDRRGRKSSGLSTGHGPAPRTRLVPTPSVKLGEM